MKTNLLYIILILLVSCHLKSSDKKLAAITTMPSFRILSIDSSACLNSQNIPSGCSTVFMYFDPDCEHCQRETKNIIDHIAQLTKVKIYMVTSSELNGELKRFYKSYNLDSLTNIFVGKDYEYSFYRLFLPPTVPYMAIYNSKKTLVKIYTGEVNVNSIIAATSE